MNTTASCAVSNLSSIYEIVQQADEGSINVTILAQSYPCVCTLAWGTGNPDLSGIGANISYIFQLILTMFFGPIFTSIYGYRRQKIKDLRPEPTQHLQDTQEYLRNLQSTFVDCSGQFSIIVAIASAVRLRQSPPFFEVAFLQSLATVQFLSIFSVSFASGVAMPKPRDKRRVAVLCLYSSVLFCFYMAMQLSLQTSQKSVNAMQALATQCHGYGGIWPGYNYVPRHAWTDWVGLAFGFTLCCGFGIGVASCILRKRTSFRAGPVSLAFALGTLGCFVQLQRTRNNMGSVTGKEFQDNVWGFGQVMAVLLWAPLMFQGMYYGIITCFPHLNATEHSDLVPLCHQCRTCNTCAELGSIDPADQVPTSELSPNDEQGNASPPKKETLLERYERWSKDHERRQDEIRAKYGSDYGLGMI